MVCIYSIYYEENEHPEGKHWECIYWNADFDSECESFNECYHSEDGL